MDYPGKVITKTQVTPTQTSASGNWTLDDQAAAIKNNNWPVALVPNPISKSLRFNSADTAYLNRTPASTSNQKKWTWSGWVKRGVLSTFGGLMSGYVDANNYTTLYFWNDNTITFYQTIGGSAGGQIATSAVFRDPSAWYHIVIVYDSANATQANRVLIYVNGVQQTLTTTTAITLNTNSLFNVTTATQNLGRHGAGSNYFDGYLTEVNFIDGQQLTPSDFGLTNPQTGQWIPKKYTGTYGTNGFYLNFKDATSTTTLGYDYSGNANNWTTNNFSVTAGVGNDSLTDVPTPWIAYNTTGDVGGVVRGNYCTLNPLDEPATYAAAGSSANGNLDFSVSNDAAMGSTISVSSGKWYWEMTVVSGHSAGANTVWAAIASSTPSSVNKLPYQSGSGGRSYATTGLKFNENSSSSYGNTYTNGDVIGCALDLDNGKVYWSKNGTFQASGDPVAGTNAAFTGLTGTWLPVASSNTPLTSFNFGQRPFAYTPPTGFRSLCTTNLPATTIGFGLTNQADDYFNTVIFTGNSTSDRTITTGLQSDFVWAKRRNDAYSHLLFDAIRGAGRTLRSDSTNIESNDGGFYVQQFNSDNYLIGATDQALNHSSGTYVSWVWNAGGSNATNTAGTVTSTVRANTTAGFSIVTWTGAAAGDTIGHGLGAAPSLIITKTRTDNTAQPWPVYHRSLGRGKYLTLNTTAAENASYSTYWGNSEPSSTIFGTLTIAQGANNIGNMVAYCFAPVAGYSAIGSYTGNGSSDGPFVYLGFRPAFLMVKRTDSTGTWVIIDSKRNTYNPENLELYPNTTAAEGNGGTTYIEDFLSNGFKIRQTDTTWNASGGTYIYAAFAESPFQFANAR